MPFDSYPAVDRIPAVPRRTVAHRAMFGEHVAPREPEPADPPAGWLLGGFFWGCVLLLTAVWGWVLVARVLPKAAGLAVEAARMTGAW